MLGVIMLAVIITLVMIFLLTAKQRNQKPDINSLEDQYNDLLTRIEEKQQQLNDLNEYYINNSIDRKTKLSTIVNEVLDIYDQSNIRIPQDIIEDVSIMQFDSLKDVYDYIETQRYYWKLENTKKPYKKVKN